MDTPLQPQITPPVAPATPVGPMLPLSSPNKAKSSKLWFGVGGGVVLVLLVAIIFGQTSLFKGALISSATDEAACIAIPGATWEADLADVKGKCILNTCVIGTYDFSDINCLKGDLTCSISGTCTSKKVLENTIPSCPNSSFDVECFAKDNAKSCKKDTACVSPAEYAAPAAEAAQTPTITTNIQATNGQNTVKVGDTFTFTASDVAESDMSIISSDASVITCKLDVCTAYKAGSSEIYASYLIWGTGEKIITNKINVVVEVVEAAATGAQTKCLIDGTYYSDTGCLNADQSCNREEIDNKEGCISPTELKTLLQEINSCTQGWISGGGPCCAEGTQLDIPTNTCKTAISSGSAESSTMASSEKISSTPSASSNDTVKIQVDDRVIIIGPSLERGWAWNDYDTSLLRCTNRGDALSCTATGAGTTDFFAKIETPTAHNSNVIHIEISPKEVAAEIPAEVPADVVPAEVPANEPAAAPATTSCTVDGYEFGDPSCTSASPCLVNGRCMSIPELQYIGAQIELCSDDNAANANPNPGATWDEANLRCVCTAQGETWNGSTCTGGAGTVSGNETRPSAESESVIAELTERNRQLEQTIYWLNVQIEDARSRNDNISLEELLALLAQVKADQAAGRPSSVTVNLNAPAGSGLGGVLSTGGSTAGSTVAATGSSGSTESVVTQQAPEIGKTLKAKAKKVTGSIASNQTLSNSDLIRIAEEEAAKRAEGGSLAYQPAADETDVLKIAEEEAAKRAEQGTGSLIASYVQGSTQSSSADTAASLSGGMIRGNSGPELLLYPILVGLANGAYFITRKKKKK